MKKASCRSGVNIFGMGACLLALLPMVCSGAIQVINSNAPSPLEIAVKDSGTPGVWVDQPNDRTYQYYDQYHWGSIIWLNGTNTSGRYSTGYQGSPTTNSPVSNTKTGSGATNDPYVITTVVKLGTNDIYMNQRFAYVNGDRYFQKNWTLTNSGAITYTDLRFFHGGDTLFGGIDEARSWWDATNLMVYVNNNTFVNCGYMGFYASQATPAAGYFGGIYTYGNIQAGTLAQLSNTTDSAYPDAGYYLQWNRTSLAPGQTWTIEAYEYWSLPGSLAVLPPANDYVEPDSTVAKVFKVHNLSTNASSAIGLSVTGADWVVSLPDGTNIALAGLAITNVNVNIVVPAGVLADVTKDITLTAISGTSTGVGSSRLTVYIPTFTITPNPLNFSNVSIGSTSDLTVTLSNEVGGAALTIGTIDDSLEAPFSIVADNASDQIVAPGGSCSVTVRFAPTSVVASADSFNWPIVSPIVYSRTIVVQGTGAVPGQAGWVAVEVTPETGSWQLTAPAGYTGPTSGTGNLAAVSAVTGQYDITYGELSGYVAPSNQSQFVTGGSTTLFTGVYLQISTNIGTPESVSATEGSYTNRIRVTWKGVAGATGYVIWRSQTNDADTAARIVDIPLITLQLLPSAFSLQSSAYYYDDYAISPIYSYYYWVRARTASLISPLSYVGMGYAALDPEVATGSADIGVSDLVYLPVNMTNESPAGTVSCRVANDGPDALTASGVAFDFHMISNAATPVWIGSDQGTYTLAAGEETLVILTPAAKRGLTARGDLSGVQQVKVTVRHLTTLNDPNLTNNTTTAPGTVLVRAAGVNSPGRALNDYDGDGKSDVALCRADKGVWAAILSGTRGYGTTGIEPETGSGRYWTAAGDYDGDGILDYGLYEEISGTWWILQSSDGQVVSGVFGGSGFRPVSADYDGDSKSDPAVYDPGLSYWAGLKSASNYALGEAWVGGPDYEPVMADYDGDGLADQMVYRASDGHWTGLLSGENYALVDGYFGGSGYQAGAADFDGDGLADPVIYRAADGIWLILLSAEDYLGAIFALGGPGYVAVPGDFDGDGRADPGVYSEQGGVWYGRLSGHDYEWSSARFGGPGYQPVSE